MTVLLIQLPPRRKLTAAAVDTPPATLPAEWRYVLSANGATVTQSGSAAAALLPKADQVVAVLAAQDVAWHRIALPRAAASRMRQALAGVLEEALLDEPEQTHFALPQPRSGGSAHWVATAHRPWLATLLGALEAAAVHVDRLVPAASPVVEGPAQAHFHGGVEEVQDGGAPWLTLAGREGVTHWRIGAALTPAALAALAGVAEGDTAVAWSASPGTAAAAERWLGRAVRVRGDAETLLACAATPWNLRQFDLEARMRGARQVTALLRSLRGRSWRWARWGLAALVAVNVIGINAYAWQQSRALEARRQAMNDLLKATHPQVRSVLDAPLQMQRETDRLRVIAGRPGEGDLEVLLAATAAHWPEGLPPVQSLAFEAGQLTLAAPGFDAERLPRLREGLLPLGLDAAFAEGRVTISRSGRPR